MIDKEKDELDQKLFEYFENNNDISDCVQKAMNDAFDSIRAKKNHSPIYKIRRVAVVLFCFGIVTSGIVFAKEIVSFITSKFSGR